MHDDFNLTKRIVKSGAVFISGINQFGYFICQNHKNGSWLFCGNSFIAVLGHDLRNPLSAIKTGSALLNRSPLSERDQYIVGTIAKSTLRKEELITNVMDFARVRLGGGILLDLNAIMLEPIITHIVNELIISFPERKVITHFDAEQPVYCDVNRLSQLISNLLANALTHGAADEPIKIIVQTKVDVLEIEVINGGHAIPADVLTTLFTREGNSPSQH